MAITYNNPDEVAKVKHILSLAEHIAEKIDGSGSSSTTTSKAIPTINASKTQYAASEFVSGYGYMRPADFITLTYNGDGDFFIDKTAIDANLGFELGKENGNFIIRPRYITAEAPTFPMTFKLGFTESDNYQACSVDITITA